MQTPFLAPGQYKEQAAGHPSLALWFVNVMQPHRLRSCTWSTLTAARSRLSDPWRDSGILTHLVNEEAWRKTSKPDTCDDDHRQSW